jgi:hypothetical protein
MIGLALAITAALASPPDISIHDTRDITFPVPYFDNAPKFNMANALHGRNNIIGQPTRIERVNNEKKLDKILDDLYGDEYTFIRWNGHLIVRRKQ